MRGVRATTQLDGGHRPASGSVLDQMAIRGAILLADLDHLRCRVRWTVNDAHFGQRSARDRSQCSSPVRCRPPLLAADAHPHGQPRVGAAVDLLDREPRGLVGLAQRRTEQQTAWLVSEPHRACRDRSEDRAVAPVLKTQLCRVAASGRVAKRIPCDLLKEHTFPSRLYEVGLTLPGPSGRPTSRRPVRRVRVANLKKHECSPPARASRKCSRGSPECRGERHPLTVRTSVPSPRDVLPGSVRAVRGTPPSRAGPAPSP